MVPVVSASAQWQSDNMSTIDFSGTIGYHRHSSIVPNGTHTVSMVPNDALIMSVVLMVHV